MFKLAKSTLPLYTKCYCSLTNNQVSSWSLLFFGSDSFSLCTLKLLNAEYRKSNSVINNLEVVSSNTKSHLNVVHKYAQTENLALHEWPPSMHKTFDIGIVVSFGHLIPNRIINAFPLGMLNVHASLLPRWRGAAPIIYAIANGDTQTGVTIMRIKPDKFDIGEIVKQSSVDISPDMRMPELYTILGNLGAHTLLEVIKTLPNSLQHAVKQNNLGVTYAPKISASLAAIKWDKTSARDVLNLSRALDSVYNLTAKWMHYSVKLLDVSKDQGTTNHQLSEPGFAYFDRTDSVVKICCAKNTWINVGKFVINRKTITAKDFNNGYFKKWPECERIFK